MKGRRRRCGEGCRDGTHTRTQYSDNVKLRTVSPACHIQCLYRGLNRETSEELMERMTPGAFLLRQAPHEKIVFSFRLVAVVTLDIVKSSVLNMLSVHAYTSK